MLHAVNHLCACIALLSLIVVLLKFISRRLGLQALDQRLLGIHRPASHLLIVCGVIHGVLSFQYVTKYPPLVYLTGGLCLLALLRICHTCKNQGNKRWLPTHRFWSALALLLLAAHLVCFVRSHMALH